MALAPWVRAWNAIRSTASRRPATRACSPESERLPSTDRTPSVNLFWGRAVTPTTSPRIARMWYPGRLFMVTTSTPFSTPKRALSILPRHLQHIECRVQLLRGELARIEVSALDDDLPDRAAFGERLLGHRGRLVVPEVPVERRDDRGRTLGVLPHPRLVRLDTRDAAVGEQPRHRGQQPDRLQQVAGHHRKHDVELEVALRPGERDRRVVADDLRADLPYRLADHRVDLARHDRRAGLEVGQVQFGEAGPRPGAHPADVVCDLVQPDGDDAQLAGRLDERVPGALRLEVVARLGQRQAGHLDEARDDRGGEAGRGVDAGTDRGAAQRQLG